MRPIPRLALAAGLVALTCAGTTTRADEKENAKALKELEGTYQIVGMEKEGFKLTEEDLKKVAEADPKGAENLKVVIKGDHMIAHFGGKEDAATIKVDASKKPAHIDITSKKSDGSKDVNHGIYKLEGGVLTVCANEKGEEKDRPKEFKPAGKAMVMTLKKQPAKK